MEQKFSLDKNQIRVLLLEGIHHSAVASFEKSGYTQIEYVSKALDDKELEMKIRDVHIIGIRSRTQLTAQVLSKAKKLISIGCYSIGTNQVDRQAAKMAGIPVFNAPFSNTRSVAELVIAEAIMLMREVPMKNAAAHRGEWIKSASQSYEIRDKNIGIVGYGHIGSQVSILAEAMGMNVYYYDIEKKLSLGKAVACDSLEELLEKSDIVTLHVPETELTINMISRPQISQMKKGTLLINASRGSVVDYDAVAVALRENHLAGAAADVFPEEPASNNEPFRSVLRDFDNVILTPHIGGSTREAQEKIGCEVTGKLIKYSDNGTTIGAVNFPQISLQPNENKQRFLHIHKNMPGLLRNVNFVFTGKGINIASEYLQTDADIGYVIIDTESNLSPAILTELKNIPHTLRARMLY
ncbi:MAG: phosphoglycerate dehydrogenase [Prolixibacteraceae bacterium]|jgi:D-3-phosphoglycerate dehydrogenase|nr:phosphoglycerate dehydrogenase [Prolixibacteraceae bacterium]OQB79501.1 MAG: D-3-phosphoglycerate dehydrogenase [Bacteroidetes bacterium ADurb.Bin123]HNU76978.1 phosphoglycerate dehydrogenase [Prolixibacteraceae bacterium]HNZ69795.1 phosphoglycerate dehydrogenase [Prolixibacteraceae bacterium]HOF56058.1 phosphoglycerate dehydrogenase [Prolixibacteraceae bacterium]